MSYNRVDPGSSWATVAGVALAIAVIVALVLLGVGWYQSYWWFAEDTTERRYDVNTKTQQYQNSLIQQNRDRAQAIEISGHAGQKKQLVLTFCQVQLQINNPPPDLVSTANAYC